MKFEKYFIECLEKFLEIPKLSLEKGLEKVQTRKPRKNTENKSRKIDRQIPRNNKCRKYLL